MSFSRRLLDHASEIIPESKLMGGVPDELDEIPMRRAVSASYYALFHQVIEDAVLLLAPNVPAETRHRIRRWFEHAEMKKICGIFVKERLEQPLLGLIGNSASEDLQTVCRTFISLQEARHSADYDLGYAIDRTETLKQWKSALDAIGAWRRITRSGEANIFILSLLLWKNWVKER